jgi:hypothetical protein
MVEKGTFCFNQQTIHTGFLFDHELVQVRHGVAADCTRGSVGVLGAPEWADSTTDQFLIPALIGHFSLKKEAPKC